MRLRPTGPNSRGTRESIKPMASMLERPPPMLRIKPGPRNEPEKREAIITRTSVTIIADLNPNRIKVVMVMMFARPTLSHGIGIGIRLSNA